ncbi:MULTISPECIES: HNH endonuclease [Pseudomonas]|uniref:HNH endonuclease n=1 Tax=Pseudomonas TaxID=286 RepID=UPI0023602701|nr:MULTISPECIES: HNH endonuclease signature motif containing protein [Pseudomonas]WJV24496.1 HNH endonuclease signature motif containing protein [Pseudomonas chlororaphis]
MPRRVITRELVTTALEIAQRIERGEITRSVGFEQLTSSHGFAHYTANAYLNCYAHLRSGTAIKATVNADGMRLMLTRISEQFQPADLFTALRALDLHIRYLEALSNRVERSLRLVYAEFSMRLASTLEVDHPSDDFEKQVQQAIDAGPRERKKQLAMMPKKPTVTVRMVKQFNRNPWVVAEVLERAQGICESCKEPAPFMRRTDGSPYLEVHHLVQLAHDGDDVVENSVALCPNCHRQKHHGAVEELA